MDLGWLTGVSTLLITLGGGIAWLVRRHDSKKDPLPREQAAVAVAAANVGLLSEVNLRLSEESVRQAAKIAAMEQQHAEELSGVRAELDEVRTRALNNDRQIAELQESQGQIKALFGSATGFIEELLRWLHAGMPGQRPELPSNLRAFIDRTLHDENPFGSQRPDLR